MTKTNITYSNFKRSSDVNIEYCLLKSESSLKKKETLVFLYGLACNNKHWLYQIDYYLAKGYDVLLHNYRFHFGSSSKENIEKCSFKEMSKDLSLLLNELSIQSTILVAHSMGVNVAIEYTLHYCENVTKLILISGNPIRPHDTMFETNISNYTIPIIQKVRNAHPKWFKIIWENAHKNLLLRKIVLHGGFNAEQVEDQFVKFYMKKIGELDPNVFFQLLKEMKYHNLLSCLHKLKLPTLIIGGDQDNLSPIDTQFILHKNIKGSQFYVVKEGSHVPQVDFPDSINERINLFLTEINPSLTESRPC